MTNKTIVSVACEIPGGLSCYVGFDSFASLLDEDIILFDPDIEGFKFGVRDNYRGKPALDDDQSFRLKDSISHWKRELSTAFNAGKTIFVILRERQEVYTDTGDRQHSGTGRNRKTTRIVDLTSNYDALPVRAKFTDSRGRELKLAPNCEIFWGHHVNPLFAFLTLQELLEIEPTMQELADRKALLKSKLANEEKPKRLLYENGKDLESVVRDALTLLGFETSTYQVADSEFDIVAEAPEGRFLGEAEGKDNKAINVSKLRQLEMNLLEDFDRPDVNDFAKGVLFGNAFRLTVPSERGDFFTPKCVTAAKRSGVALVRTPDLFPLVQYLSEKDDPTYATKCRKAILETNGELVVFPATPKLKKTNITGAKNS